MFWKTSANERPPASEETWQAPVAAEAAAAAAAALSQAELRTIQAQIEQARGILSDAIGKLGTSFTAMEDETKIQRDLMASLFTSLAKQTAYKAGERGHEADTAEPGKIDIREFTVETEGFLTHFTDLLASVSKESIRTVYRIDDMVEQLDAVFNLIASVDGLADETFLLAINASIEAAHLQTAKTSSSSASALNANSFLVIATNMRELSKKTRTFNNQIGTQIGTARATVSEVREIIAAMASRDLNVALAGKQRIETMMGELRELQAFMARAVERATVSNTRISEATSQAVTGLQFEDLLNQLLVSIRQRAARLAGDEAASPAVGTPGDPVRQGTLAPGEVELF